MSKFVRMDERGYEIKLEKEEFRKGKCESRFHNMERLCMGCGNQLVTIGEEFRKNGKKNLNDWQTRPFHKNCYAIVMRHYKIDNDLRPNSKCPSERELIIYFESNSNLTTEYLRMVKNINQNS